MTAISPNATTLPASLDFEGIALAITDQNGQPWLTLSEVARALYEIKGTDTSVGTFKNATDATWRTFKRHADEFTADETALIDMPTAGGVQKVRVFSGRGARLMGMISRAPKAKSFRVWALDHLDAIAAPAIAYQPTPALPPPAEPPFCTGCAARDWWNAPAIVDKSRHPLKDGPMTFAEMNLLRVWREALKEAVASAVTLPPLPADISVNLGDRVDTVIRAMADLVEFTRATTTDNARLRRETEQFAAIKAILMGDK